MNKEKILEQFEEFMTQQALRVMEGVKPPVFEDEQTLKQFMKDQIQIMSTTHNPDEHLKASCTIDWAIDLNRKLCPKLHMLIAAHKDKDKEDDYWDIIDRYLEEN
jgi:hypothetical protein